MQEHPLLCTRRSKLKAVQWPGISLRQANGPYSPDFVRCGQFGREVHSPLTSVSCRLTQISRAAAHKSKAVGTSLPSAPQESPWDAES